ncbi:MAG: S8 family serine peptidase [Planctomycetota bacterium]
MRARLAVAALFLIATAALAGGPGTPQVFQVPGSPMLVSLWERNGTAYWSVAPDGVAFCEPQAASYEIPLRYAAFDPALGEPAVPAVLAAGPDTHLYLVQYHTQPFEPYRAAIGQLGGTVYFPVPNNADLALLPAGTEAAVAALPFVRAVRAYQPAYRVDPQVLETLSLDGAQARYSIECVARGPAAQAAVAALIQAAGGVVHFITPQGHRLEATCDPATLLAVARHDAVNYIESWPGPAGEDIDIARGPAGHDANYIETVGNFRGQGVRGEVLDGGVRMTHVEFQDPPPLLHMTNSTSTSHGTSTYGEVFARGVNPRCTGMLPQREQGIFGAYNQLTGFGGSKSRYDHTAELVDPNLPFRAVFQTASFGSAQVVSYTTISAETDDYLFMYDLLSCQSQSNTGNQLSRPQAWAKNIVAVGGFYHNNNAERADDRYGGASIGPASDGRVKPDVTAYYDNIYTTCSSSDTCYSEGFGGTSGATPMTCGAFGLLFQMWHEGVWAGHGGGANVFASRCHMATAKALMINSAYMYKVSGTDPGQPGTPPYQNFTRFNQGWGMANLKYLYDQAPKTFVIDETDLLVPMQTRLYRVNVAANQPAFKVTLVYTDPKGNPAVQTQHRINNLDLKVTAPDSTVYWGNNGMTTSSWTAPGGAPNTKDTVENVFIQSPAAGLWKVEIIGAEIVQDSHVETPALDADYALVVYGGRLSLGDMNCDGVVNFDDINPFVLALTDPAGYAVAYPNCNIMNGDINGDGVVNFDDINPFVAILTNP